MMLLYAGFNLEIMGRLPSLKKKDGHLNCAYRIAAVIAASFLNPRAITTFTTKAYGLRESLDFAAPSIQRMDAGKR
jgi:hypothetical protein